MSACDVHTFASHQVLEARKMRDYVNLAQLELRSLDSLSCMLPGAGWPQEKCAQGWRSGNKAQAIPYRRSLRATSSHTRSQRRAHLAGVGKHLAYPPAPNGSLPFIFLSSIPGPGICSTLSSNMPASPPSHLCHQDRKEAMGSRHSR